MNILLIKSKINSLDKTKDVVICNLENLVYFPIQIFKKDNGDLIPYLPKRNRTINFGINTEYIEFFDMKKRDEFLEQIKKIYKKGIDDDITLKEIEGIDPPKIKIEFISIDQNPYVIGFLNVIIEETLKIKGFKVIPTKNEIKITSPCFMKEKEKDLLNRFKITKLFETILVDEYKRIATIWNIKVLISND